MRDWKPGRCPACNRLLVKDGLLKCGRCSAELVVVRLDPDTPSPAELRQAARWIRALAGQGSIFDVQLQDGRPARLALQGDALTIEDGRGNGRRIGVANGRPVDLCSGKPLDAHQLREIMAITELTPRR